MIWCEVQLHCQGPDSRIVADPAGSPGGFLISFPEHRDGGPLDPILKQLKRYSAVDLARMARSFAFKNCQVMKEKLRVLKSHIKPNR